MKTHAPGPRPESRCRSGVEAAPRWDLPRHGLRSEAFAEDLPQAVHNAVAVTMPGRAHPWWGAGAQGRVDGWFQAWFFEGDGFVDRCRSGPCRAPA